MYKKVLIAGATAATIVGAGTAALAATGSGTSAPVDHGAAPTAAAAAATTTAPSAAVGTARHPLLRRVVAGQVVTRGKSGFVTHDLIRGAVTAVSPTSITVTAANKQVETFAVTAHTKVWIRAHGARSASKISAVSKGATARVVGTGTTARVATQIVMAQK